VKVTSREAFDTPMRISKGHELLVAAGDIVEARQPLVVLEAMKMETPVTSPFTATVKAVHVIAGDQVAGGALLVELES
jgi:biotin carboxyl carrier protein